MAQSDPFNQSIRSDKNGSPKSGKGACENAGRMRALWFRDL